MNYIGDFAEDETVYFMFNTFTSDDPSASCTITNFLNTDVHIHKDDGLAQRNNAAGITVSVDFDGITGSHMIKIDTNDNTVAGFWVTGSDYFVRIEGTTVDGATINAVVGHFSIENRLMRGTDSAALATTALTNVTWTDAKAGFIDASIAGLNNVSTADVLAQAQAALQGYKLDHLINSAVDTNWATTVHLDSVIGHLADVGTAATFDRTIHALEAIRTRGDAAWATATSSPNVLQNTTVATLASQTSFTLTAGSADDDTYIGSMIIITDSVTAEQKAVGLVAAYTGATKTITLESDPGIFTMAVGDTVDIMAIVDNDYIADAVWDEILTGTEHNITTSAGKRVRAIGAYAIHDGTAQAGNSHTITLAATADANDGVYNRNLIVLTDNTGVGQTRTIVDYDATTKICVMDRDWRVSPDATTAYQIVPDDTPLTVDHGVARGGTSRTITIRAYAASDDDAYLCNIVAILAGKGRGQARLVHAYDGTTNVVTICGDDWIVTPDTTSVYAMMPYGVACAACVGDEARDTIADGVWDEDLSDHTTVGTAGKVVQQIRSVANAILGHIHSMM